MEPLKTLEEATAFIKEQVKFLLKRFEAFSHISVSFGTYEKHFGESNINELYDDSFIWSSSLDRTMKDKLDNYIRFKKRKEIKEEPPPFISEISEYKNFGTIYIVAPGLVFEVEFIEGYMKNGHLSLKQFTYTRGKIGHNFVFAEVSSNWDDGVKNAALSFKHAFSSQNIFLKERCGI